MTIHVSFNLQLSITKRARIFASRKKKQFLLTNKPPDERTWSKKSQLKAISASSASRHCTQEAHTLVKT